MSSWRRQTTITGAAIGEAPFCPHYRASPQRHSVQLPRGVDRDAEVVEGRGGDVHDAGGPGGRPVLCRRAAGQDEDRHLLGRVAAVAAVGAPAVVGADEDQPVFVGVGGAGARTRDRAFPVGADSPSIARRAASGWSAGACRAWNLTDRGAVGGDAAHLPDTPVRVSTENIGIGHPGGWTWCAAGRRGDASSGGATCSGSGADSIVERSVAPTTPGRRRARRDFCLDAGDLSGRRGDSSPGFWRTIGRVRVGGGGLKMSQRIGAQPRFVARTSTVKPAARRRRARLRSRGGRKLTRRAWFEGGRPARAAAVGGVQSGWWVRARSSGGSRDRARPPEPFHHRHGEKRLPRQFPQRAHSGLLDQTRPALCTRNRSERALDGELSLRLAA